MRPRSLRTRLMLWYTGILAAILLAFAAVAYFTVRSTLSSQLDDGLANRALLIERLVVEGNEPIPSGDDDAFVRAFSPSGEVLWSAAEDDEFRELPIDMDDVDAAADGDTIYSTIDTAEGSARVLTSPVRSGGEVTAVLQIGESTEDMDETTRALGIALAVALPSAIAVAALGGWWLSSRALRPVDRMTRTAAEISSGQDLSRRLDIDSPDDEVGRLARTFDAMIARLEAAFQRQREFTTDASHELRTPLTAIRGQIDVALERPRDADEYRRVLATVNGQVERLTRLSDALLTLARADGRAAPPVTEPVDVGELVDLTAEQIRPTAERKGLQVSVEKSDRVSVSGSEDLLLQLLLNLADNAVKYTERGSVTLGWRHSEEGLVVFVRDTGAGIAAEERERIFERFYRGDATRSSVEGEGLGLAIARWVAEAHGGTLTVEADNTGSTFRFHLPLT